MLGSMMIFILSIKIIQSLKCHGYIRCTFTVKFGDSMPTQDTWDNSCTSKIDEDHFTMCSSVITVSYEEQSTSIKLTGSKDSPPTEKHSLRFFIQLSPNEKLVNEVFIDCFNANLCAVDETIRLLPQLAIMKGHSLNIFKGFEQLLRSPSSDDTPLSCIDSNLNTTTQCSTSKTAVCQTHKLDVAADIVYRCFKDDLSLSAAVYYDFDSSTEVPVPRMFGWFIGCNQNNCNTKELTTKVVELAQQHVEGTSNVGSVLTSKRRSTQILIVGLLSLLTSLYT